VIFIHFDRYSYFPTVDSKMEVINMISRLNADDRVAKVRIDINGYDDDEHDYYRNRSRNRNRNLSRNSHSYYDSDGSDDSDDTHSYSDELINKMIRKYYNLYSIQIWDRNDFVYDKMHNLMKQWVE